MLSQHRSKNQLRQLQSPKRQQGVVIVVALFIVALTATMAYLMIARFERDTRRTMLILRDTEAELLAEGSIAWAIDQLRNNWEKQKTNQIIDIIPIKSPVNKVNGYEVSGVINDMQAKYNINNLSDKNAQADFKRLLLAVQPKLGDEKATDIAKATFDWVSPLTQKSKYDQYYMSLPAPYRSSHRPMVNVSELRMVQGVTPDLFAALQPYVTALPVATLVNIQTAAAPVLVTLSPSITLAMAEEIKRSLEQMPTASVTQAFSWIAVLKNSNLPISKVAASSSYFLVETDVKIEKQHLVIYTLLERATSKDKVVITILGQSKGVW